MLDEVQLNRIQDPDIKRTVQQLAHLLELALTDNDTLRAEVQSRKDEINRLKGERGKPTVKPNRRTSPSKGDSDPASDPSSDHSSEEHREARKP